MSLAQLQAQLHFFFLISFLFMYIGEGTAAHVDWAVLAAQLASEQAGVPSRIYVYQKKN
jgi:hypothetical protein